MALSPGTCQFQSLGELSDGHRCSENEREVQLQQIHQVQVSSKALYSHDLPHRWATAASALGHICFIGNSHQRRSIYAALYWQCHEAYRYVHTEVQVGSPGKDQRMDSCWRKGVGQTSEAISYRWRRWAHLQEICRIPESRGHTKANDHSPHFSV